MELKAKNISKKVTKLPKTVSLSVSTGFPMRDSLYSVVQRSLTMSNIYLNFLQFFQSRIPLLFKSGTLLQCATLAFSTHDGHVTHIHDARWSHATFLISFQIPTCDNHVTHIHNTQWSHAALLISFWIPMCDGHMTLCSPCFKFCIPKSWNVSISVSAAQTEIDPKMTTQADSLFGSTQTLISHVVMIAQGCVWLCKAV